MEQDKKTKPFEIPQSISVLDWINRTIWIKMHLQRWLEVVEYMSGGSSLYSLQFGGFLSIFRNILSNSRSRRWC